MRDHSGVRVKRAIFSQAATKSRVRVIVGTNARQTPQAIPDAASAPAPKVADPLAGLGLASALGVRKSDDTKVVKLRSRSRTDLRSGLLGVTRKAAPIIVAYGRADAADTSIQAFANAGAHEFRREGRTGRNVLRATLVSLAKGDVLMVEKIADIAIPADLPKVAKEIEAKGVAIVTLDGIDTRTVEGRGKLASRVLSAKQLFPGLRL